MKLQNEVIEITQTMSAMAQSSKSEIESHTNYLSHALEQGILSQDQRLKNFETVIQNSLERLTLGIEDRLNNQKIYLDNQMKSYDEKFNAELRDHTVGASRRNHQKQNNVRTQNSPMNVDESANDVRKKDSNFMAALNAFPSEKRFSNSSTSESWIIFKQYIISHCDEYSLTPFESLKLAKANIVADKCATILLQINITTILPPGQEEIVKKFFRNFRQFVY